MARRRKEERRAGIASRGIMRRWGRLAPPAKFEGKCFSSRVRHRVVPERDRVPDRCHPSGSAVDVCSYAPAWAQRAERAAEGGVVYVLRALSVSPRAPRIHAQRGLDFTPIIPATACKQRNYVERYNRFNGIVSKGTSEPVDRLTLFGGSPAHLFARMAYVTNR